MRALYGTAELPRSAGVLHVAAVAAVGEGPDRFLKIGPESPRSAADAFALSLSRARADAIVTTAKILRDEPSMRAEPFGRYAPSLLAWRARVMGRARPPSLLILSQSGEIPLAHPALSAWVQPIVVTGAQGAAVLRERIGGGRAPRVHEMAAPGVAATIAWAREELGAETISIEAGPSTVNRLYEGSCAVDELLLSVFEGAVPGAAVGAPFVGQARLRELFGAPTSETVRNERTQGRWRIQRWCRGQA